MKKIIAEFCQNFKGERGLLRDMIHAAAAAGATHAKVQSYRSDELTRRPEFEPGGGGPMERPYAAERERLKKADLSDEDIAYFVSECKQAGIKPLITVFTRARVRPLAQHEWDEVKVASYDCASYPLLADLAKHFRHLYVSTGATYDREIEAAAKLLLPAPAGFTFLHCVTKYPTPLADIHLARLSFLKRFTPSVGFSDHSLTARDGILASLAALALGAEVIERHFTVLPAEATKDGPVSVNPAQLGELAVWSKQEPAKVAEYLDAVMPAWREITIGSAVRPLSEEELRNRAYYRGRFASRLGDKWVYNWEEEEIHS